MINYRIEEPPKSIIDGQFAYYKEESTKYYHGLSLLVGADICFGKKTNKFGGIINIAAGTVRANGGEWGGALNLGIGLVFRK